MEILFVHGAGGWVEDQPLADALRTLSGHQFDGRMAAVADGLATLAR